jgi:1,3-beta-galactosyl-N-acetylhexosamine phosphorylase
MLEEMTGRVTIPTDEGIVEETLETMKLWGADALRDCDGTEFPKELVDTNAKKYKTYYTTRKDNAWAKANPDEIQQIYIMSLFYMATEAELRIPLMKHIYPEMLKVNTHDDIKRWWEVVDRTTGQVVPVDQWHYEEETTEVVLTDAIPYHEYTVSFLAYIMWDPVHMYNAVVNDWKDVEKQMTFDVRQPKTHAYSLERLRKFCEENPHIDVIRFTTFFHQFTLIFDELARERYVDWYGYSASVSPYILEQFEKEVGYAFRPEYIIDQGYYNNQYRVPTKEYLDFMAFQRREVCALAKELVDICHEYGKEAMMFLGDHFIGTEPYMEDFEKIGLDAVVGSVGNGSTLRLISDIKGVKYTEGRFLPYFFPDTFHEGGDPTREAKENWVTARRAILRKPVDRIGYGGYLKLALEFPDFVDYITEVTNEFRELYSNARNCVPYNLKKVAFVNCWGKLRAWGNHMVHHALYQKQNYQYAGVTEILSGSPFDVHFISFDEILENPSLVNDFDVLLIVGQAGTAHSGGAVWDNPELVRIFNEYVYNGGGLIGVGQPSAFQKEGRYFQLRHALGVEEETGLTLNYDKYNWEVQGHFITQDVKGKIDFGEGVRNIYADEDTVILADWEKEVQMAAHDFGQGRSVYISGLPFSFENARILLRAILWASHDEENLHHWYSDNYFVDVHAYVENKKYCVVNNTFEPQHSIIYTQNDQSFEIDLAPNEIRWFTIE